MIFIPDLIDGLLDIFPQCAQPWEITAALTDILRRAINGLGDEYTIKDDIAIHRTAIIEEGVVFKAPVIIGAYCFIGAHTYLRGGVYLGESVSIGPGCEIKSSIILSLSAAAHFNFIGDSIIGSHVNFEAGAVIANHHNDRPDKRISVVYNGKSIATHAIKFGALVGDHCKIGANAVLSPGTVLLRDTVVRRLELVEQG